MVGLAEGDTFLADGFGWREENGISDIIVEMKRIQEMNENITKRMDNQESDPRSWIERWKGTADNIYYCFCNIHYLFFTMPWDTHVWLVGWLQSIRIAVDGMERENTEGSRRINMESFPLPD